MHKSILFWESAGARPLRTGLLLRQGTAALYLSSGALQGELCGVVDVSTPIRARGVKNGFWSPKCENPLISQRTSS